MTNPTRALLFVVAAVAAASAAAAGPLAAQSDSLAGVRAAPAAIRSTMRAHLFDPRVLDDTAARRIAAATDSLAHAATDRRGFVGGVNRLWRDGPVSHVRLDMARMPAAAMAGYVDTMRVGPGAVTLRWVDRIAVLEVRTMMGIDTREAITSAFREIVARGASGLIIDLRANPGGAFAVVPLVGHLIDHAVEGGVFVGRRWTELNERPPAARDVERVEPWRGWSLTRFWGDVESSGLLRIRFEPMAPRYAGPVVVLTARATASAAELAVDALLSGGRAVVVGERTAGQMLSQRMFDIPGGLQLSLPIADYYSDRMGRIEGVGIAPTVAVPAAQALDSALTRLGGATPPRAP